MSIDVKIKKVVDEFPSSFVPACQKNTKKWPKKSAQTSKFISQTFYLLMLKSKRWLINFLLRHLLLLCKHDRIIPRKAKKPAETFTFISQTFYLLMLKSKRWLINFPLRHLLLLCKHVRITPRNGK